MSFIELDILDRVDSTSGKNDKQELLTNAVTNTRLAQLLNAAYNFYKKYHIKKFDMPQASDTSVDRHDAFIAMLDLLSKRGVTGDAAKSTVENFFAQCDEQQQKWYYKVLQKDLKMGVSIDTAIKCGFSIPKFDVMLAKDGYKNKKAKKIVENGGYASRKFNGYRCLVVCDGNECTLYSRNGSVYSNFPTIKEELERVLRGQEVILDGEIMSDDFSSMQQSAFASTRGTTVGDVKYHVFGMVPYDEWMNDSFKASTAERLIMLDELFDLYLNQSELIKKVEQIFVDNYETIVGLDKKWVSEGFEGAMFLPADLPYYLGKKEHKLMKFKSFETWDCEVVACVEGDKDGKYAGTLGALKVIQENGVDCEVGTGFSDADRDYIWQNQELIIGRLCEVQYQELSKKDKRMIFPSFKRWRDSGKGTGKK